MKGRVVKESGLEKDQYGYIKPTKTSKSRLDLNDLLERRKNEKKDDTKVNSLILFGVLVVALVFFLILKL